MITNVLKFTYNLRKYVVSLPKNRMKEIVRVIEHLVLSEHVPLRILLLVQDMMAYRFRRKSPVQREITMRGAT